MFGVKKRRFAIRDRRDFLKMLASMTVGVALSNDVCGGEFIGGMYAEAFFGTDLECKMADIGYK